MPIRGPFCAPIDKVKSLNRRAGLPILLGRFGGFALDLLDQPAVVGQPEQVIHRVALARRPAQPELWAFSRRLDGVDGPLTASVCQSWVVARDADQTAGYVDQRLARADGG
jgi:hypothetical protein